MKSQKKILILLALIFLMTIITACSSHNLEEVRMEIKKYLYEKYGEEFIVDRIGTRNDDGETEYVARIYPKSIIGTNKEGDSYYYGSASIDKTLLGGLEGPGDSYSYIMMNQTGEKYLLPKVKEIFGDRVLLKVDSEIEIWGREKIIVEEYKKKGDKSSNGVDAFIGYKESNFEKAKNRAVEDPKNNKLFLELYIYIFDQIDNKAEQEKRRKEIFRFIQYLKREGLFKYLEMGVIFIDERVLADGYDKYREKVFLSDKVKKEIQGKEVYLPPLDLREEMSRRLQNEIDKMSEKELIQNMKKIKKRELRYKTIRKYNSQCQERIYSLGILKENYNSSYRKHKSNNELEHYYYNTISDIEIANNLEYIYLNE